MAHPERLALAKEKRDAEKATDTFNLSRPDAGESVNLLVNQQDEPVYPKVKQRDESVYPVVNQREKSANPVLSMFLNESIKSVINQSTEKEVKAVNPVVIKPEMPINPVVTKKSTDSVKLVVQSALEESDQELNDFYCIQAKDCYDKDFEKNKVKVKKASMESEPRKVKLEAEIKEHEQPKPKQPDRNSVIVVSPVLETTTIKPAEKKDSVESVNRNRSTTNVFTRMISEYANALDLNDFERNCLGFAGEKEQKDEEDKVNSNKQLYNYRAPEEIKQDQYHKQKSKPKPCPQELQEKVRNKEKETIQDDYDESSTWGDLVDKLFLKSWFESTSSTIDDDDYYNRLRNEKLDENRNEKLIRKVDKLRPSAMKVNTDRISLFKEGVLDLLDQICDGDHIEGNNNCYKCQYKDIFKSFTQNYLGELDSIWNCGELSPQQVAEKMNETMEMWIYQLAEQNLSLAGAYNTSLEASEKLKRLLIQSRNSMRTLQKERDKDKACIDALTYELSLRDKTIKKLKYELEMELEKMRGMEDTLQDTQADVQSLTELIIRLRDKGVWDIHGLPLGDETFKKIFSEDYYLHGAKVIGHKEFSSKKREWRNEIDQLKSEADTLRAIISAKDKEIQRCSSKSSESNSTRLKFDSRK